MIGDCDGADCVSETLSSSELVMGGATRRDDEEAWFAPFHNPPALCTTRSASSGFLFAIHFKNILSSIAERSIDPFLEGRLSENETVDLNESSSENECESVALASFDKADNDGGDDGVYDVQAIGGRGGGVGMEGVDSTSSVWLLVDANFSKDSVSKLTVISREAFGVVAVVASSTAPSLHSPSFWISSSITLDSTLSPSSPSFEALIATVATSFVIK